MLDDQGLVDHLRELDESLGDWERYRSLTLEDLKLDRDKRNMALHALLVSLQASIDIATHIVADQKLRKPSTYREAFEVLGEAGVLPADLSRRMAELAGFRNVITHIYWRLNLDQVYGVLQNDLDTVRQFETHVRSEAAGA